MIINLTISLLLKTRRIKLPWTIEAVKALKGLQGLKGIGMRDVAKESLMSALALTTVSDPRILDLSSVMGSIADADDCAGATGDGQPLAASDSQRPSTVKPDIAITSNDVYIFTGDYINPTGWTTWDERNPQWKLINGLKDLQQRKNPLTILNEEGTPAALEEISINLHLLPSLCEGDDVSLADLVLEEWRQVIEENQLVFFELQADIAHAQWTRSRNLRHFPIPESLDESLEGKYKLEDDEESLPDLTEFLTSPISPTSSTFPLTLMTSMTPAPTPIATTFGNLPGTPKRWSDFDDEDDSLPDISEFIATTDMSVSECESAADSASETEAEPRAESASASSPLQDEDLTEITISHVEDVSFSSFSSDSVSNEDTSRLYKLDKFALTLTCATDDSFSDSSRLSLITSPSPLTPILQSDSSSFIVSAFPFPPFNPQGCCPSDHRPCALDIGNKRKGSSQKHQGNDWLRRLSGALMSFRQGLKT